MVHIKKKKQKKKIQVFYRLTKTMKRVQKLLALEEPCVAKWVVTEVSQAGSV